MLPVPLVIGVAFAYLVLLFAVAYWGDRRARQGRSVIGNAWVYALSMAVYCTAWTYFGSVGRAATSGVWFLPIYLGPMLGMILAWTVVRKMIRIAKTYRITSIADFIASRYGKSPLLAGLVTVITVIGIVPYIALQLKGIASGYALLTTPLGQASAPASGVFGDSTVNFALAPGKSATFNSEDLENGSSKGTGAFGDGAGRWYVTATAECGSFVGSALNRNLEDGTITNLTPQNHGQGL